jgi:cell division septation protein DedD
MRKKDESTRLGAEIPFLMFPVLLIAWVIRYPVSLVVIVPVVLAMMFLSPSGTTPQPQAPRAVVERQPSPAPAQPPESPVQLPVASPPTPPPAVPAVSSEATLRYRIQVGAFESEARAVTLTRELAIMFSDVFIEPASGSGSLYRVYVGRFVDQSSAQPVMSRLQHEGLSPLIVPLEAPR